jgi:hypothetical protein
MDHLRIVEITWLCPYSAGATAGRCPGRQVGRRRDFSRSEAMRNSVFPRKPQTLSRKEAALFGRKRGRMRFSQLPESLPDDLSPACDGEPCHNCGHHDIGPSGARAKHTGRREQNRGIADRVVA